MKNQVQLTAHALETWIAALSVFDPEFVNQAVLEIGLSADPFPDLGKLVLRCDSIRCEKKHGTGSDRKKIGITALKAIARAMNLEIPQQ